MLKAIPLVMEIRWVLPRRGWGGNRGVFYGVGYGSEAGSMEIEPGKNGKTVKQRYAHEKAGLTLGISAAFGAKVLMVVGPRVNGAKQSYGKPRLSPWRIDFLISSATRDDLEVGTRFGLGGRWNISRGSAFVDEFVTDECCT